jgi:trigger factor
MGIADGDVAKMRAEIEANLKREVKRRIEGKLKDQVMEALIKTNPITVPSALVDMEIQRLMQAARQDMEQRGMKIKDMPIQPEWFADQAKRRVTLGLILAEVVKTEKLQANPGTGSRHGRGNRPELRAAGRSHPLVLRPTAAPAGSRRRGDRKQRGRMGAGKAKVTDKAAVFDELMGQKQ